LKEENAMAKYCPECGKELSDNPKFCPECGKQIEGKKESVNEVFKKRHARKGIKKAVMIIIFIFAAIAVIYVFYTYLELNGFISPMDGLSGTWEGSGTFTNNCDNPACEYVGTMNPPSVILQLQQNGNMVFGTVTINIPQSQVQELLGQPCYGFDNSVSDINNGILSSTRLTFMDDGGNIWTLNFLSDNCQGTVGSNAIGCTGLQGDVSLSKK
jgi:endogenous inhibitor of DNA gyrase (YacG/DUF329 family)